MIGIFDAQREADYRERSNNACMAGIAYGQSFICRKCKQPRDKVGRKPVINGCSKAGYFCAECAALASSAAGIADVKTPPSAGGNPRVVSIQLEQV